ncbi:TLD-domain-containing protein [Desarmillaria tabescens]|uniref:Oxidation resistance protein 1 n=1 Tax=Armillaria tabescens TaxID=1929756 RepID=A0AA39NNZ9_ARMTA|nr:TLD-domain-containing protein [Desarmillaria tabescens]KAK0469131.1 TLD-domain-containing protein [Desarmillaria tabescens]
MSVHPSSSSPSSPVSRTSSRHHNHSPTRSPTLSAAMPAPPIASTSSVSSTPPADDSQSRPSSRWMNSLRKIDSLYHLGEPAHREHSYPSTPVNISHKTPFAPHGNASEASSIVYIPPTGAPGYRGEAYDWDTGALEKKASYVDLKGRRENTVSILDVHLANMIRNYLPALSRLPRSWSLLYSLDQHGISLNTLYTRCEQPKPCGALVVFKDEGETIFGAFVSDGIRQSRGRGHYVFKWTGRNGYVALCEPGYMSFGGGDGSYGLYIDANLLEGSSAPCPTFANEPLCSPGHSIRGTVPFECVGVEVWRVG